MWKYNCNFSVVWNIPLLNFFTTYSLANNFNINISKDFYISKHISFKQSFVQCPSHFEDHRHVLLQRTFSSWRSVDSESHCQQHIQEQVGLQLRHISTTSRFLHCNGHVLQLVYHDSCHTICLSVVEKYGSRRMCWSLSRRGTSETH